MRVRDVMNRTVETVRPGASLQAAAHQMREAGVGFLPVVEEERLEGVITDRDIVVRGVGPGADPHAVQVRDAMSVEVYWCHEDHSLEEAGELMTRHGVRRLVVLDRQGKLVGVVSLADLLAAGAWREVTPDQLQAPNTDAP